MILSTDTVCIAVTMTRDDYAFTAGDGVDHETAQGNAEFIVLAINSYELMLDTLREVRAMGFLLEDGDAVWLLNKIQATINIATGVE